MPVFLNVDFDKRFSLPVFMCKMGGSNFLQDMCVLRVRPELLGCWSSVSWVSEWYYCAVFFFLSVGNNRNSNLLLYMKSCEGKGKKKILKVH